MGGEGVPCVARHELGPAGTWQKDYGRPCPKVELLPANRHAQWLLWLAMHEHTRGFVPELSRRLLSSQPDDVAADVLIRVGSAMLSPKAMDRLYPKPTTKQGTDAKQKAHTGKKMNKVPFGGLRDGARAEAEKLAQLQGAPRSRALGKGSGR